MALVIAASPPFIIFLLFFVAKLMHLRIINNQHLIKARLPPGPVPWPIIGCIPEMLRRKPTFRWILGWMKEMDTEIACFHFGNVPVIPVTCPAIAQEFLKKQDAAFASRPQSVAAGTFSGGYKTTILSPYGETWKKMRKVLNSEVVSPARHQWLHDKRIMEADNLIRYIYNQSKNFGRVNLRTACRQYTGNVMRRLMFNQRYFVEKIIDDGAPTFREEEHVEALFETLRYLYGFCISDYLPYLAGLDLDGHEKIIKEVHETILKYHEPIIRERIQKWREDDGRNFRVENELEKIEPQDLLDVLISLKDSREKPLLTQEEIIAQTWEIMIAGIDNPANAVEWAMAEMINNPEILNKAEEEVDKVVGIERVVQEQDIPNLNYVKACARESFRLHPLHSFNPPHLSLSETVVAGYRIPKGSHIILSRRGLGRNPKVWDKPLEFRPERHLLSGGNANRCNGFPEEVLLTEPKLRFISFSTGRRGCIGITLGTVMTVMLLARIVQGFLWMKPPELSKICLEESDGDLSLANPLVVCAKPRLPSHLYIPIIKE
ncbi:tyrosine N-monooxygenase-like [Punica granatum]|uniref:Tyrosine N-monooxygenase-like n=1 Tax=Punica granatum TaxID=22663 RepID=A0A6P8DFN1_PUNGR|nr:tyrosine N-monooxygenase-like [Punica granatum]